MWSSPYFFYKDLNITISKHHKFMDITNNKAYTFIHTIPLS